MVDSFVRYVDKVFDEVVEETIENGLIFGGQQIVILLRVSIVADSFIMQNFVIVDLLLSITENIINYTLLFNWLYN